MLDQRVIELLTRKMAGEATEAELAELRQCLEESDNARYTWEIMEQIWDHAPPAEPVGSFYKRHMRRHGDALGIRSVRVTMALLARLYHSQAMRAACVLILVAGLGLYYFHGRSINRPETQQADIAVRNGDGMPVEIVTGKGIRKNTQLPDGTRVWLNADSRLSYAVDLGEGGARKVELRGEAFFDVAPDKNRPFIIHTDELSIRVLGTSFNVKAYPQESRCEATLIKGAIELSINKRPQQKVVLKPSEKFSLTEGGGKTDIGKFDSTGVSDGGHSPELTLSIGNVRPILINDRHYVEETSWKDDRLVFDSETLEELKTKLERWYDVKIDIRSERAAHYRFTGIFTTETIDRALAAMRLIKPFNYKINNHEVIIY